MRTIISTTKTTPLIRVSTLIADVEFQGQTRKVILVAKTVKFHVTELSTDTLTQEVSGVKQRITSEYTNKYTQTKLGIGMSVCNPSDEYKEEFGIATAASRALNSKQSCGILDSKDKSIDSELVQFKLQEKMRHIKAYPKFYFRAEASLSEKTSLRKVN